MCEPIKHNAVQTLDRVSGLARNSKRNLYFQRSGTMSKEINDYIQELEKCIDEAHKTGDKYNFIDPAYDIIEGIENLENPFEAVEPILRLIERSPDIDYGGPGPFGSFVEKFSKTPEMNYEKLLVESLQRKPTEYTVYLLDRICRVKTYPDRPRYVKLIKTFADSDFLSDYWKEAIRSIEE